MAKAKEVKRGPGRPPVYFGKVLTYIVSLIRDYNAKQAMSILNASNTKGDAEWKALRNKAIVPDALGISYPTMLKIAGNAGIELERGRPKSEEAAEAKPAKKAKSKKAKASKKTSRKAKVAAEPVATPASEPVAA